MMEQEQEPPLTMPEILGLIRSSDQEDRLDGA